MPVSRKHYRLGALYSLATSLLLAMQEPFSSLGAKTLTTAQYICVTQIGLLLSVPLLIAPTRSRRDFFALLSNPANFWRLLAIFAVGLCGLLLYNVGLSNAHPIIIAAILNLSPFWAAIVAKIISRKPIPVSSLVFFSCLTVAFIGAMTIAWSQMETSNRPALSELAKNLARSTWIYAIPIPILYALSGTLIGQWFSKLADSAAIAASFVVSAFLLIPAALAISLLRVEMLARQETQSAIALLLIGTLVSAALGRLLYQVSLSVTHNDNGFVTMFFLLVPALTAFISVPLSWGLPDLRFMMGPLFYLGLALVAAPLIVFSIKAWR